VAVGFCAVAFVAALAASGVSSRVGSPPTGDLATLEVIALVIVGSLVVVGLFGLTLARGLDERRLRKMRMPLWRRILVLVAATFVFVVSFAILSRVLPSEQAHPRGARRCVVCSHSPRASASTRKPPAHEGPLATSWARAAAFAVGGAIAIAALFLLYRQPKQRRPEEDAEVQLDHLVTAGIHGLESDPDPRRAVIKAYAGMEHALAEDGLPRGASETPLEYLERALGHLHVSKESTAALTGLYEQAKFSSHVIDEPMRQQALAALESLRAEIAS
jgi:hypothetical protein